MMEIKLSKEEIEKAIKIMTAESGTKSFAALARDIGLKETTFRSAIHNNSIRLVDFIDAAETMGFEVVAVKKEQ